MCVQCGCINDPVGTAVAWAESGARNRDNRLQEQIDGLREEIAFLRQELNMLKHWTGMPNVR